MNILFLTISRIFDINSRGIYTDLIREFRKNNHQVYIVCPVERKYKQPTSLRCQDGVTILNVKTFNLQKINVIEKGVGTLAIEYQFKKAIKKHLSGIKFDLILYSTPPITLTKAIAFVKKRDQAKTYLLLKDIFPQNAIDIEMMSKGGLLHRLFRKKEKSLYAISDHIGCMSPANVGFVIAQNKEVNPNKVEVCPNSIEVVESNLSIEKRTEVRAKYKLPLNKKVFIYGGNLGKPQGLDFLIKAIETNKHRTDAFFLIVGTGTEFSRLENWFNMNKPSNALLLAGLPKQDYDLLVQSCDIGLIFLDPRFTIPNYPSRLLSYLEYKMPVLMATDINTDIGRIAEENGYGYWCENGDVERFNHYVNNMANDSGLLLEMGRKGYAYLSDNYTVIKSYNIIMKHFE